MGGGDLNLKKSWHPHTIKNQEKVWKAEQAKMSEEKRMRELEKEIRDEKDRDELRKHGQSSGILPSNKNPKLEWMYKNSAELLNRDEYLLGKAVDRNFEELDKQEKSTATIGIKQQKNHVEHDVVPFSIREYKGVNTSDQVDLQRKLMEDPLMAIRQKEMESRRKILENPVKLKELHRILKTQTEESSKKNKKSKKKHKKESKKKKRRDSSSSSSSSDEDLDKMLVKQIKEIKKNSNAKELEKLLDSKYDKISKELDKAVKHKKKKSKKGKRSDSDSRTPEPRQRSPGRRRERSASPRDLPMRRQQDSGSRERRRSRSPQRNNPFKMQESRNITNSPPNRRDNPFSGRKPFNQREEGRPFREEGRPYREEGRPPQPPFNDRYERKPFNYNQGNNNRSFSRPQQQDRFKNYQKPMRNRSRSFSPPVQMNRPRVFDDRRNDRNHRVERDRTDSLPRRRERDTPDRKNPFSSPKRSSRQMSSEEKQRRLQEMTQNAAWRDEDRSRNVQKYREDYRREEEAHKSRDFDNNFVHKQVHKAFDSQNSVESRLKSHKNNIQRSSNSMNYNFARK
ncbi:CWC25 family protein [Megaselia abdita]